MCTYVYTLGSMYIIYIYLVNTWVWEFYIDCMTCIGVHHHYSYIIHIILALVHTKTPALSNHTVSNCMGNQTHLNWCKYSAPSELAVYSIQTTDYIERSKKYSHKATWSIQNYNVMSTAKIGQSPTHNLYFLYCATHTTSSPVLGRTTESPLPH